jgi:hypothetical protein
VYRIAMTTLRCTFAIALGTLLFASGCEKPCDGIPQSQTVKDLGFVFEGGRVCKDEKDVASVDYPGVDGEKLDDSHKEKLEKAGWKVEMPSDGTLLATKDKNTLFIVTGAKSSERGVPFAVVRYCQDEGCRKSLSELAAAMKK